MIINSYTRDKFLVLCVTPKAFDSIPYVKNSLTGIKYANDNPIYHKIIPVTQKTVQSISEKLGISETILISEMNRSTEYFQISKIINTLD